MLTNKSIDNLVLGTVNASWKHEIDADTLACAVSAGDVEINTALEADFVQLASAA